MMHGTFADILASVEVSRIELEYASADLAAQCGIAGWRVDANHLETMLASLHLARAALAMAQATLAEGAGVPAAELTMAKS